MKSIPRSSKIFGGLLLIISVFAVALLAGLNAQGADQLHPKELAENNLEPFAGAYKEVSEIHTTYEQRIVQSGDQAQAEVLQQEANQKMNQAVTDHGLTIEDYNAIFRAILNDPALKEDFMTVMNRTQ